MVLFCISLGTGDASSARGWLDIGGNFRHIYQVFLSTFCHVLLLLLLFGFSERAIKAWSLVLAGVFYLVFVSEYGSRLGCVFLVRYGFGETSSVMLVQAGAEEKQC